MSEERRTELDGREITDPEGMDDSGAGLQPEAGEEMAGEPADAAADAVSAVAGDDTVGAAVATEDHGAPPAQATPSPIAESDGTEEPVEGVHEMTFTEHLNELRIRLVRCIIAAGVGFLICYGFAEQLFELLMRPLVELLAPTGGALIYTGLPEAFFTQLQVAAIAGLFVASPYIFYQLWMFIAPGLYEGERKYIIPIAFFSALCFVSGALFGYFVVFPYGFQFFLGYATEFVKPMPSVKEYFSFATGMLFAFGLIFELPLFMFFLAVMGLVTHKTLRKFRKFAVLGAFVVGAILTPPDVVSQCLMAGPLCILYEIGIWVAYIFGKRPKEPESQDQESAEANG